MNLNKLTEKAQEAVVAAQRLAESRQHTQVEPEHLRRGDAAGRVRAQDGRGAVFLDGRSEDLAHRRGPTVHQHHERPPGERTAQSRQQAAGDDVGSPSGVADRP